MKIEEAPTWVEGIAVGFLCITAAVTLAVAAGRAAQQPRPQAQAQSSSGYVPPGMHEAQADVDVGPGSDEAQLATSSWGE